MRRIVAIITPAASNYARAEVELECGHSKWVWNEAQVRAHCRKCAGPLEAGASTREAGGRLGG